MPTISGLEAISTNLQRGDLRNRGIQCPTLIYLVSKQLAPAVISFRFWAPDNIILIYTQESAKTAESLQSWIDLYLPKTQKKLQLCVDPFSRHWWNDLEFGSGQVVADITGGTKIMSLGLYECSTKRGYKAVYYYDDGAYLDVTSGEKIPIPGNLLAWQDLFFIHKKEVGGERVTPQGVEHLVSGHCNEETYDDLFHHIKRKIKDQKRECQVTIDRSHKLNAATLVWLKKAHENNFFTLDEHPERLILKLTPEQAQLQQGFYLEYLVAEALHILEQESAISGSAVGVKVRSQLSAKHGTDITDIDAVFTFHNSLVFVSCKSGSVKEAKEGIDQLKNWAENLGGKRSAAILVYDNLESSRDRMRVGEYAKETEGIGYISDPTMIRDLRRLARQLKKLAEFPLGDL